MERSEILEKIRKLMRLTESPNEHEAALAAKKAQALIEQFNVELFEISDKGMKIEYVKDEYALKDDESWRVHLMSAVARNTFCRVIVNGIFQHPDTKVFKTKVSIIGQSHNVEFCEYLYAALSPQVADIAYIEWRKFKASANYIPGTRQHGWRLSFIEGCVQRIGERLSEQHETFSQSSENSRALVVQSDEQLQKVTHEYFPKLGTYQGDKFSMNHSAYGRGRSAANDLNLNRPLGEHTRQYKIAGK